MTKITKIHTDEPTNFQGYELNENNQVKLDSFLVGEGEFKRQTDGTLVVKDKLTGITKTLLDLSSEDDQSVNKTFSDLIVEDSSTAFQPLDTDTVTATDYNTGREQYQMAFDFQASSDRQTIAYRGKSTLGLVNVRVLVYNLISEDPTGTDQESEYNELITGQWWMTKNHVWNTRTKAEVVQERRRITDDTYTSPYTLVPDGSGYVSIEVDVTYEQGKYYRILVCADNAFDLKGVNGVDDPINGGTQFFLYTERTYRDITYSTTQPESISVQPTDAFDFYRDATNTTIILSNGQSYPVNSIKAVEDNGVINLVSVDPDVTITHLAGINHELVSIANGVVGGSVTNVVNQLNQLFAVLPLGLGGVYTSTLPTLAGVDITANFAEGQDPLGDSIYGVAGDTSQHGARVWSDETIDDLGEFYEVKITGKGQFMLGLYSVDDGDLAEITNNSGNGHSGYKWANAFYNYGSYIAPWTTYGSNSGLSYGPGWNGSTSQQMRYNTTVQTNLLNADPANPVLFKVGINAQGYIAVYYFDEGRSNDYIMTARSTYTLPEGQYGLLVKLVNGAVQLVETPERTATDPSAPILTYRYVESNGFDYPLFESAEEANYYDSQNGGIGESSVVIYPDDSSVTQWYKPANGFTQDAANAPTDTSEITWNEIPTTTLVPDAFSDTTIEVNEGDTFNIPVAPADADFLTSVNINGNTWASYDGVGHLTGTAPEVTGDYNANPNDEYTFPITRTSEASSTGTLTIRVINLTAPITAISGFNHVVGSTAMIDSDTMDDGSVVHVNTTVADGERFVIEKSYIQTNILPALQGVGDQYIIGLENIGADFSTVELSDFDAAIVWEYESATSHTFKFYRDGSLVQNIVISSMTDAFYDYAIEINGTSAWLIACNVNSIMNEPSPADGGSFSHTYEVTNIEDTPPSKIHMAVISTTADISTTGIETVTTPTAPVGTTTPFTKAVDFSGTNEYLAKANSSYLYTPMGMGNASATVAAPTAGQTVASGHPWACTTVFKIDGNSSNQHIWNYGEGAGTTDDNIYLRVDANRNIYFGWGRQGELNELFFGALNTTTWYGCYIGFNGTRLSGNDATPANLADVFEIRLFSDATNWQIASATDSSTSTMWGLTQSNTGGRMDRQFTGTFAVGGRGANRNFHGKVASMMVTTLRCGVAMPDTTEIELMVTNPIKWVEDYKLGNLYRRPSVTTDTSNFALNSLDSANGTQLWLMGNVSTDSYSNGIRSYIYPTEQNRSKMQFNSMASNDIEDIADPIN